MVYGPDYLGDCEGEMKRKAREEVLRRAVEGGLLERRAKGQL